MLSLHLLESDWTRIPEKSLTPASWRLGNPTNLRSPYPKIPWGFQGPYVERDVWKQHLGFAFGSRLHPLEGPAVCLHHRAYCIAPQCFIVKSGKLSLRQLNEFWAPTIGQRPGAAYCTDGEPEITLSSMILSHFRMLLHDYKRLAVNILSLLRLICR